MFEEQEKKAFDLKGIADEVNKVAVSAVDKTKELAAKSQAAILGAVDQNGNGEIDIEDVIIMGLKVPGIRIDRASFLQKELQKSFPQDVIDDAIENNPMHAGIPAKSIDKIADEVIKYERACVSGISTALGMPGGVAMAATIPADIAQYYGYMLRMYDVKEGFILPIHHDCGSFVVNGSGYDERKNLRHNRYFHCERSCTHEQGTRI